MDWDKGSVPGEDMDSDSSHCDCEECAPRADDQGDEQRVIDLIRYRLAQGRREYGPLDVNDGRDWGAEGVEELIDLVVYWAAAQIQDGDGCPECERLRKQRDQLLRENRHLADLQDADDRRQGLEGMVSAFSWMIRCFLVSRDEDRPPPAGWPFFDY